MLRARSRRALALVFAAVATCACSNPEKEKVSHVEKGDRYAAEKKDDFALIEYASAVKIDPRYGDAHLKLAQTYERMNDLRGAFPAYIRAADALPANRDVQVKAIEVMLLSGRFDDAKARAVMLVSKNPKDVRARLLQANAMAALGDSDGALSQIGEAQSLEPQNADVFINLGTVRAQRGEAKDAEAAFREAISLSGTSVTASLAFADFLASSRRPAEAEEWLKRTLTLNPNHLLANRMLATLYVTTQRMAQAEQPLKVIAEVSKTPSARFELADYYVRANRDAEAVGILNALSKERESFAEAEVRLAAVDRLRNRTSEAFRRVDSLLTKVANYPPALVMKAEWLVAERKFDEAMTVARRAVAAAPQSFAAHAVLGSVQENQGQAADAIKSYTEVLRLNPRTPGTRTALSRLTLAAGQRDAALRYAEEARRAEPTSGPALVALIRSLMVTGNWSRVETEVNLLVKAAPDAALAHILMGELQLAKRNATGAKASFERALVLAPGSIEALAGLNIVDVRGGNARRAVERLESEIAKGSPAAGLLALAAQAYEAAGDQQKAEQLLRRAVIDDPAYMVGYAMLTRLYVKQGRLDQARAEYETMAKLDPSQPGPRTMIGILLEAQGRRDEARKVYEDVVAGGADSAAVAANNLAYIYAEQNTNLDMALQLATGAKPKLPTDPNVDDTIGWVYYKKDLASLAIGPLEESLRRRPDNAETMYHLGLAYAKVGNKPKARDVLSRAVALDPKLGGEEARKALAAVSQ
jgi:tetratricopeptide (TPR) repeat protein